jgi:MFS family permease
VAQAAASCREVSLVKPFQSPAFRRLWVSGIAATIGQGIERTATAWLALEAGGGAVAVGTVFAARMLPSLLFGLAAGTIADRADRPRQLLAVAVGAALLMAAFGWFVGAGAVQVWQVVAFAFAAGCVQVFDTPARQALVLDTVSREAALRGLSLTALAARCSTALGALGAGLLIPQAGVAGCFLAAAAAYALTAAVTVPLRVAQEHRAQGAPPPFREAFRGAARLMLDVPALRTLVLAGVVCEVFAFSHMTALPLFAQEVLRAGPEGLGVLNGAAAAGGALAVALLALLPGAGGHKPLLGATFVLYGLAIVGLAFTRNLGFAAAVLLLIGCCAAAFDVLQQTLIQMAVPDSQRGRAVGIWVLSIGSAPFGHLEMGLLIAALGVPGALLINGAITVLAAAGLLLYARDYRPARRGAQSLRGR